MSAFPFHFEDESIVPYLVESFGNVKDDRRRCTMKWQVFGDDSVQCAWPVCQVYKFDWRMHLEGYCLWSVFYDVPFSNCAVVTPKDVFCVVVAVGQAGCLIRKQCFYVRSCYVFVLIVCKQRIDWFCGLGARWPERQWFPCWVCKPPEFDGELFCSALVSSRRILCCEVHPICIVWSW